MKKIVLSMAMIASIALVGCENTNSQQGADTASATTEQAAIELLKLKLLMLIQ
jgi:lipoprotein